VKIVKQCRERQGQQQEGVCLVSPFWKRKPQLFPPRSPPSVPACPPSVLAPPVCPRSPPVCPRSPLSVPRSPPVCPRSPRSFPARRKEYLSMVGSLMYVAIGSRPDIAFSITALSRYNVQPLEMHAMAAKRVLRYLKSTSEFRIHYRRLPSYSQSVNTRPHNSRPRNPHPHDTP